MSALRKLTQLEEENRPLAYPMFVGVLDQFERRLPGEAGRGDLVPGEGVSEVCPNNVPI